MKCRFDLNQVIIETLGITYDSIKFRVRRQLNDEPYN